MKSIKATQSFGPYLPPGAIDEEVASRFVLSEQHLFRKCWDMWLACVLIITALYLPYRIVFVDFALNAQASPPRLQAIEWVMECTFYVDFVLNFFLTFRSSTGDEVFNHRKIVRNYLLGYFLLNLLACLPPDLFGLIVAGFDARPQTSAANGENLNKLPRLVRLQRFTRIARILRLGRLARLSRIKAVSLMLEYLRTHRGFRICNSIALLFWTVHLAACGWVLCAYLHEDPEQTWLWHRTVDKNGEKSLLHESQFDQWCHAMYFTLTVFTTVGFGDMSAGTKGEMAYVSFVMLVGAVVNGAIVSEVMDTLTSMDRSARQVIVQQNLARDFADHVHLSRKYRDKLLEWAGTAQSVKGKHGFDMEKMESLLISGAIPRQLLGQLPNQLFKLKTTSLVKNQFVRYCNRVFDLPPRFSLLMSMIMQERYYTHGDAIYYKQDHSVNLFLVLDGICAAVALPSPAGGLDEVLARESKLGATIRSFSPYQLYPNGSYFGDYEIFVSNAIGRRSCVRSETNSQLLVVAKRELGTLISEFPRSEDVWRRMAKQREQKRLRSLQCLHKECTMYTIAANVVATTWCKHYLRKNDIKASFTAEESSSAPTILDVRSPPPSKKTSSEAHKPRNLASEVDSLKAEVAGLRGTLETEMSRVHTVLDEIRGVVTKGCEYSQL